LKAFTVKSGTCPFKILKVSHYNEDGSCRCKDKSHVEMKAWGYRWNEQLQRWEGAHR